MKYFSPREREREKIISGSILPEEIYFIIMLVKSGQIAHFTLHFLHSQIYSCFTIFLLKNFVLKFPFRLIPIKTYSYFFKSRYIYIYIYLILEIICKQYSIISFHHSVYFKRKITLFTKKKKKGEGTNQKRKHIKEERR